MGTAEVGVILLVVVSVVGSVGIIIGNHRQLPRSVVGPKDAQETPLLALAGGGARFGLMNYTMPMGTLTAWSDGIEVDAPGSRASMKWLEMRRATLIQPLIPVGSGVRFEVEGRAPVIYWTSKAKCLEILDVCERQGTEVQRQARLSIQSAIVRPRISKPWYDPQMVLPQ